MCKKDIKDNDIGKTKTNWIEIESKNYIYTVYKKDDDSQYKLHTYKPKHGGLDVIHYLTDLEKDKYIAIGIRALDKRINDMDINYSNYKIQSWR